MAGALRYLLCCFAFLALSLSEAAGDRVRTLDGSLSGEVVEASPLGVTLQRNGRSEEIAIDQIRSIIYEDEPAELSQARLNADNGAYLSALEKIEEVALGSITDKRVLEDLTFYQAFTAARLAIAGQYDPSDAGRKLTAYVRQYGESYHYFAAVETLGDLWASLDKPKNAEKMYRLLAKSKSPTFAIRGAVLIGRMKQAAGDHKSAIKAFEIAMKQPTDSSPAAAEYAQAALSRGVSLAALGKFDEGLAAVQKVIQAAGAKEEELIAKGYISLGRCFEEADKRREALFAYIYVDTLFSSQADQHAEALFHLIPLWKALDKDEEASAAQSMLRGRYAQTSWAQKDKDRSGEG